MQYCKPCNAYHCIRAAARSRRHREPRAVNARPTSMLRILPLGVMIGVLVAGCGTARLVENTSAPSLQITRTPGLFILPPLAATIRNPSTVNRLLDDIRQLPPFPVGTTSCPVDFGTSYKLEFRRAGKSFLTAVISVQGCQGVQLSDGGSLWAAKAPSLFTNLGAALSLKPGELIPLPCPPPSGTICYPQPWPAS
jgi:hypothetical protein